MLKPLATEFLGEKLRLFPEKAIFWERENMLIIADLHLGKVNHFRKAGIPVPEGANITNIERLIDLLKFQEPKRVVFLGDLFHSHYNEEWEVLGQVLGYFPEIRFELVEGNHDIMSPYQYEKHSILVHKEPLNMAPFLLSHEPNEEDIHPLYNIAGHVHPSVSLAGKARQRMKLPCFYFGTKGGLLPAFGAFTGTHRLSPKKKDKVFVIVDNQVLDMSYTA